MAVSDAQLIGMEKQAALDLCKAEGVPVRITSEDGRAFMVTDDYVVPRLNLGFVKGKVFSVHHG